MAITSVRISETLEPALDAAAHDLNRPKSWVINEALRNYLNDRMIEKQRWQDTVEALEDIRMGRVVDGNKVHAWLDTWGSSNVSPLPRSK